MEELIAKYLADELEAQERADFEKQLVEDEQLRDSLEESLKLWHEVIPVTEMSVDTERAWSVMPKATPSTRSIVSAERRPRYTFLKIAATLLIVLTAGYLLSDYGKQSINSLINGTVALNEFSTEVEMKEFQLPDGSTVKLNANSKVSYQNGFGTEHRNLTLIGGANFDVARDERIPFVINTEQSRVEVLGTSFDVNAYPGKDIELNVTEGQVKFSSSTAKNEGEILQAGERAILSDDGKKMQRGRVQNQNYAAWWTRKLVFESTSFEQVVKDLENTYWVKIDFSPALAGCPLSGTYEDESLESVITKIIATYPQSDIVRAKIKENHIKLEGKACAK